MRAVLLALGLASIACGDSEPDPAATSEGAEADEDEAGSESETGEPPAPGDSCETTELRVDAPAELRGSLQRATTSPVLDGSCGIDGPVVFFSARVASRVDLSARVRGREAQPKLALMRPGCVSTELDPSRVLTCADTLPVTLFDVGPDLEFVVAVGLAADDPALDAPEFDPEAGELDPLEFELELGVRVVLEEGERCDLPGTRCEAGTVCLASDALDEGDEGDEGDGDDEGPPRCLRPPADSCGAPGSSVLALDTPTQLEIPSDEAHSDAHEHGCTGWRRPERVERLELPASLPEGAQLRVHANDGRVGLALRGPSCAPEESLACTPALGGDETFLQWEGAALVELAASGEAPLLFVELPRKELADTLPDPLIVNLELVTG